MTDRERRLRDYFAAKIIGGMCAGDWKFTIADVQDWDKQAVRRAYEIADAMLAERKIDNVSAGG